MSFYYGDWKLRERWIMQMHCAVYRFPSAWRERRDAPPAFRRHHHEMLEVLAVRQGALTVYLDGERYDLRAGEALAVNPFQLHYGEWRTDAPDTEYLCLTVDLSAWLGHRHAALTETAEALLSGEARMEEFQGGAIFSDMEGICRLFGKTETEEVCGLISRVYRLLGCLLSQDNIRRETGGRQKRDMEFMRRVSNYLTEHIAEPISTADIAAAMFMTVSCFCYTFKRHFGMSFLNYLSQYRVLRSVELYSQRAMSLAELATEVGFSDYAYFSRSFKRYMGASPTVYFGKRTPKRHGAEETRLES